MTTLLATIIRLALLAAFVYAFIVLFERGPSGFVSGLGTEWKSIHASYLRLKGEPVPADADEGLPTP